MIVRSTQSFRRALEKLDRSEQLLVLRTVEQIKAGGGDVGKTLSGVLHQYRSIRTGTNGRLRIVFGSSTNQLLWLIVVGPRDRGMVYIQAIQVLKELER